MYDPRGLCTRAVLLANFIYYLLFWKRYKPGPYALKANPSQGPKDPTKKKCNPDSTRHLRALRALVGPLVPFQHLPPCKDFIKNNVEQTQQMA